MNLEQLRGFVAIARLGTFTLAAEQLHLAQPSLSRQIATLEADLGTRLFDRSRSRTALTAAGETLLPIASRMLADADAARRELAELEGLARGRVRLGATPTLCVSLVAEAVAEYHGAHPAIELTISEHGSRDLIDELAGGELDLALITVSESRRTADAHLQLEPLLTEDLVVVSSRTDPPLDEATPGTAERITLAQLARLPQIDYHRSYDLRATTREAYDRAGLVPNIVIEGAEMDAVLRFVERGVGVAVVPAMVLLDRPGLHAVRLDEPRLSRTVSVATRAGATPSRAAAAMRRRLLATANTLVSRMPDTTRLLIGDDRVDEERKDR